MIQKIIPPANLADLLSPKRKADLQRAEDLVNALMQLKAEIRDSTGALVGNGTIQINGDAGILTIVLL